MAPIDFDDDDISGVIEDTENESRTSEAIQTSSQELDSQMSEVEKRLEMAQYYRLVLNDTIFNDPPNAEVANRVEAEIRDFVRSRMALLVGVGETVKRPESVFNEEEVGALRTLAQADVVAALKALAAKVLKKPTILDAPARQETPVKPKVIREPTLKKIVRTPSETPLPSNINTQKQNTSRRIGKKQEKIFKTVVNEAGEEVKMDITPQARPVGVTPFPTPRGKDAIENFSAQNARQQAVVAISNLDKQFSGK